MYGEITLNTEDLSLLRRCADMTENIIVLMRETLTEFNKSISDLLLTLQLIHPVDVTKICTIKDLLKFQSLANSSSTLSAHPINQLINLHQFFCDKVTKPNLYSTAFKICVPFQSQGYELIIMSTSSNFT